MVAVVILVMAIFGIFHAYSVGFMGMADSRDRTVATNYMREIMEDIKNTDFDAIKKKEGTDFIFISGKKFTKYVTVDETRDNIKKVSTIITWDNDTKRVQSDMLVHFVKTTAGAPTRIMLVANPYNILTVGDDDNESIITAVVKDAKGNTVTAYNGEITFSITVGDTLGSLQNNSTTYTVSSVKGVATTTFTASNTGKGEVIIIASANELADDSVTIKITDPGEAVKINLTNYVVVVEEEIEKLFMIPGSTSKITATIVDAAGDPVLGIKDGMIFIVSDLGSLDNLFDSVENSGIATIELTSSDTPGTITVTASINVSEIGVISGVINVITGGKIYLSTSSTTIPIYESSEITVTTKDVRGVPINYIGTIKLSVESTGGSGSGTLSSSSVTFNGTTSAEKVTFTARGEGDVNIEAYDSAPILEEGDTVILPLTISPFLVPDYIEVYANPSSIKARSEDFSTITARVKDAHKITITSYTDTIVFKTTEGSFSNEDMISKISTGDAGVTYKDGIATVKLYPPMDGEARTAEIKVFSPPIEPHLITGSTEVGFYIAADRIKLVANPQRIEVISGNPNACIITATIKDEEGNTVSDYDGKVKFSIVSGDAKFALKGSTLVTVVNGEAQIVLRSGSSSGTVGVEATSSYKKEDGDQKVIDGYLNIPVGISLDLANNIVFYFNEEISTVSFDIDVQGADLLLEEMQVSWDDSNGETLIIIEIDPNSTGNSVIYPDTSTPISSGELINIEEMITLFEGTSNVKMYFNAEANNMSGKSMEVIFNPNSGNYPVEFTIP